MVTTNYFTATAHDREGKVVREFKGADRMMQNFIDAVRSRKTAELYGPMEEGHISSALCHLGGISHALGRAAAPTEIAQQLPKHARLAEATERLLAHATVNQVDFSRTPLLLGATLTLAARRRTVHGRQRVPLRPTLSSPAPTAHPTPCRSWREVWHGEKNLTG